MGAYFRHGYVTHMTPLAGSDGAQKPGSLFSNNGRVTSSFIISSNGIRHRYAVWPLLIIGISFPVTRLLKRSCLCQLDLGNDTFSAYGNALTCCPSATTMRSFWDVVPSFNVKVPVSQSTSTTCEANLMVAGFPGSLGSVASSLKLLCASTRW